MQPTTIGWVAAAALLVGFLCRLIKTDMLKIALANLGLPPVPKRVLPWVALGLGLASSILDTRLTGTAWPEAIVKGLIAAVTAIAGHELGIESVRDGKEIGGPPSPPAPPLTLLAMLAFVAIVTACTPEARWAAAEFLARKVQCALAHRHLADTQLLMECAVDPKDAQSILDIVGQEREHNVALMRQVSAARCGDGGAQ